MASFLRASASSRSSLRRSSTSAASALGSIGGRRLQQRRELLAADAALLHEMQARAPRPVTASMRRTPAATAPSPTILNEADVAGAARHACRRTVRSNRSTGVRRRRVRAHGDDAHLLAVLLAEQRHGAGVDRRPRAPSAGSSTGVVLRARTRSPSASTAASSSSASSAWGGRSRSAAGPARPASPSARRGRPAPGAAPRAADASPSGWRGWRARRAWSTASSTRVADLERCRSRPCRDGRTGRRASSACR